MTLFPFPSTYDRVLLYSNAVDPRETAVQSYREAYFSCPVGLKMKSEHPNKPVTVHETITAYGNRDQAKFYIVSARPSTDKSFHRSRVGTRCILQYFALLYKFAFTSSICPCALRLRHKYSGNNFIRPLIIYVGIRRTRHSYAKYRGITG